MDRIDWRERRLDLSGPPDDMRLGASRVVAMVLCASAAWAMTRFPIDTGAPVAVALCALNLGQALQAYAASATARGRSVFRFHRDSIAICRWIGNVAVLLIATFIVAPKGSLASPLLWVVALFGIQFDIRRRSRRTPIQLIALASFLAGALVADVPFFEATASGVLLGAVAVALHRFDENCAGAWERALRAERHEAELALTLERMRGDAAMGAQIGYATHELKNAIFLVECAEEMDETMRRIGASSSLKALVERLLDDPKRQYPIEQSAKDLVAELRGAAAREGSRGGVTVRVLAEDSVGGVIFRERLGSAMLVFLNLIRNAVEASSPSTPAETPPTVEIKVAHDEPTNRLVVTVLDRGTGMDETTARRLMRGEGGSTKKGGHGVGMRLVLDECRKNGFEIRLETHPGRGAAFRVEIPVVGVVTPASPEGQVPAEGEKHDG